MENTKRKHESSYVFLSYMARKTLKFIQENEVDRINLYKDDQVTIAAFIYHLASESEIKYTTTEELIKQQCPILSNRFPRDVYGQIVQGKYIADEILLAHGLVGSDDKSHPDKVVPVWKVVLTPVVFVFAFVTAFVLPARLFRKPKDKKQN